MNERECGSILILVLVMIATLLMLGLFLQDHLLMQARIVQNVYMEMKSYYLSQAGLEYARYHLRRDIDWRLSNHLIQVNDAESILLKVDLDDTGIIVESCGVVQQFQTRLIAHFTPFFPIKRID